MKVTIYQDGAKLAAKAENGTVILAILHEKLAAYKARVAKFIDDEFLEDAVISVVTPKELKKMETEKLKAALEAEQGNESPLKVKVGMLEAVIAAREKRAPAKAGAEKKQPAKRKVAATPKRKVAAEKSTPVNRKGGMTMKQCEAEKTRASKSIGKFVNFKEHDTGDTISGQIRSVTIDKRVPMVLYKIVTAGGLMRRKVTTAKDVVIDEAKTQAALKAKAAEVAKRNALEKELQDLKDQRKKAKTDAKKLQLKARAERAKQKEAAKKEKVKQAKADAKARVESAVARVKQTKEKAVAMIKAAEAKVAEAKAKLKTL